ncbi:MAG TPA: ATP-dependent helicase HrpB, partial [Cyanobium sp.]|nr:ATP-dependent helicase HrpB [Cyanobium sp.]
GLALVRQARDLLRPDLRLLVMSATLDLEPLAAALDNARVISCEGRSHSVEVMHQLPRERERLEHQLLRGLEDHWLPQRGHGETVLVFLPGQKEIQATHRAISSTGWGADLECTPLHGQLPLAAQARAIEPARRREGKVVLATAIAESSLTIEGVHLVIDSGLSRRSRFDPTTGMNGLVTVPASLASAEQRRGRAGRLGPGRCLRLWSPADQHRRPAFDPPELLEADPVPLALQLAAWGAGLGGDLPWITAPPRALLEEARHLLVQLGALDPGGTITAHGRAMALVGLHPRLGHMLLLAEGRDWLPLGCALAVLLSERDPLPSHQAGCDLMRRLEWLRRRPAGSLPGHANQHGDDQEGQRHQLRRLEKQLLHQVREAVGPRRSQPMPDRREQQMEEAIAAHLLSWAYPERIALARGKGDGRFLLRGGRGALLHPADPLAGAESLAVASVDGEGPEARVLLAVRLPPALLEELAANEGISVEQARWDAGAERIRCERALRLGALVLKKEPWPQAEGEIVREALLEGLRQMGLESLPWCRRSRQLQQRLVLAHEHLGPPWPDRRQEVLEEHPLSWLDPQLAGIRSRRDLQRLDLVEALWGELDWERRRQLAEWLPEELALPSGRRAVLDYSTGQPVLAVKLQELFGCGSTPVLLQGRLPITIHLLSPAGRPTAITQDLERFWANGYAEVRRDLRGRYPKHPWPEDPRKAEPTALTRSRQKTAEPGSSHSGKEKQ